MKTLIIKLTWSLIALSVLTFPLWGQNQVFFEEKPSVTAIQGAIVFSDQNVKSKSLAFASADRIVKIFDAASLSQRGSFMTLHTKLTGIALSNDGKTLFSSGSDGNTTMWDISTGSMIRTFAPNKGEILRLGLNKDNSCTITYGVDKRLVYTDIQKGERRGYIEFDEEEPTIFAEDPLQPIIYCGTTKGNLTTYSIPDNKLTRVVTLGTGITTMSFTDNGLFLITGGADGSVKIWDTKTLTAINVPDAHRLGVKTVFSDRSGKYFGSLGSDSTIKFFKRETAKLFSTLSKPGVAFVWAGFLTDNSFAAADTRGTLHMWSVSERAPDKEPPVIVFAKPGKNQDPNAIRTASKLFEVRGAVYDNMSLKSFTVNGKPMEFTTEPSRDSLSIPKSAIVKYFKMSLKLDSIGANKFDFALLDDAGNTTKSSLNIQRLSNDQAIEIIAPENNSATERLAIPLEFRILTDYRGYAIDVNMLNVARRIPRAGQDPNASISEDIPLVVGYNQVEVKVTGRDGSTITKTIGLNRKAQTPVPGATASGPKRDKSTGPQVWAVVIGVSEYKSTQIAPLQYAHKDAEAFADFLKRPEGGNLSKDNMMLLLNKDATLPNVQNALINFLKNAIDIDLVLVYFAGHGLPEPDRPDNMYLLTYDADPTKLGTTAFPMWQIRDVLERYIKAKRIVVFSDACHSGGITVNYATRGLSKPEENPFNTYFLELSKSREGTIIFAASAAGEVSQELPEFGHGVFTYYILEGMKGEADLNNDKLVTIGELMQYVEEQVKRKTKGAQTPTRSQTNYDKELPIAVVRTK
jgi:WD40 repeat protein/uncharacterized caspase-like protein